MNLFIILLSMIAVVSCGTPRPGCENCRTEPNRCVPDPKQCPTTPCNQYRCIKNKPGVCPRMGVQGKDCKHDQQCPKTEKCCRGNCIKPIVLNRCGGCHFGDVCLPITVVCKKKPCKPQYRCVKRKPGVCPRMGVQGKDCKHDQQCPKTEKCCRGNCIKPIGLNRCGGCHFGDVCLPITVVCKKKPCKPQYRCVKRKPGVCPRMRVQGKDCKHDQQCPKTEKCCRGNCIKPIGLNRCGVCHFGQKCLPIKVTCAKAPCKPQYKCISTFPKPGKCPIMVARHYGECKYDRQCLGNQKCCNGKCVQPKMTARPGRCPYYRFSKCLPTGDKRDACAVDTDCKAPMKCCRHCGKKCTMPMPKPGVCPVSKRPCILKIKRKDQCTNDYECKGRDKCCKNECGTLVCVKK